MNSCLIKMVLCIFLVLSVSPAQATHPGGGSQLRMSLDVKETDIRDVVRMISKGYDLNIILDKDVSGKVTLHLSEVPIMEGLRVLAQSNGLEVSKQGSVYRIQKATQEERSFVRYHGGYLTVDVQNIDVIDFIKEISSKAVVSIVPESNMEGKISGKLYQVPLDDGLRALLEGNGFKVRRRRDIYRVSSEASAGGEGGGRPMSPRRVSSSDFYVNYDEGFVSIDVTNGNLDDVLKAISEQSEIEIVTYGHITGEVNAKLNDMPLGEAFAFLLGGTKFTFVQKDQVILIGDRNTATPSGQALSKSELIHLKHIKADEVPKILPKNIPTTNVRVVKEQNALLVSGTSEDIVSTREFLNTIDIPTPQVVIEAIVVEYSRNVGREFGLEYGNDPSGETGSNAYSYPFLEYKRKGEDARALLRKITSAVGADIDEFIGKLPDNFYMTLRMLEEEGKAKVLAKPQITVLNGNQASINVGQTQYYRIVAGTSDNPTFRFQPISFGIKLDITPWISLSGQITAEIRPEISNAMGTNDEGYPNVFRRSIVTTVRLENGQTLVLGGLLRSDESVTHKKVPILGDIPILGNLFKSTKKNQNETNLVIYITPRIVETNTSVNIDDELRRFDENSSYWGGSFFRSGLSSRKSPPDRDSVPEHMEQDQDWMNNTQESGINIRGTQDTSSDMSPETRNSESSISSPTETQEAQNSDEDREGVENSDNGEGNNSGLEETAEDDDY
ncbi:MAG: type II secretion system protein GspD [Chitinivibrionales bacterium]